MVKLVPYKTNQVNSLRMGTNCFEIALNKLTHCGLYCLLPKTWDNLTYLNLSITNISRYDSLHKEGNRIENKGCKIVSQLEMPNLKSLNLGTC